MFPIFYAVFLIPAGEELVPLLQTVTAYMCMALLGLVGIPAHIEGIFITTPDGYFEVAEACSGVKFLVAMVAYGALVANVCFRSWTRRFLFMLAAVYGWVFFAVVIALLMAAGWRFFDRKPSDPWFDPRRLQTTAPWRSPVRPVAAGIAALAALPLVWSTAIALAGAQPAPAELALPQVRGWTKVPSVRGRPWQPHFAGADLLRSARYRDAQGREVDLAIAVFARQAEGRELVGYGQGAVGPDSDWAWIAAGPAPANGRLDRIATHGIVREVATFYRVGHRLTGRGVEAKLETIRVRLIGGPQRAVAILVSSEAPGEGESPRPAINAFLSALGPIAPLADQAAGLPRLR
jgi:EpsI family protein